MSDETRAGLVENVFQNRKKLSDGGIESFRLEFVLKKTDVGFGQRGMQVTGTYCVSRCMPKSYGEVLGRFVHEVLEHVGDSVHPCLLPLIRAGEA